MVFDTLVSVADTVAYTSCVKLFITSEVEVDIICILTSEVALLLWLTVAA